VKLIVSEVVLEWPKERDVMFFRDLEILPKPEGTTWYPDARVFVRTRPNTPRWIKRKYSIDRGSL